GKILKYHNFSGEFNDLDIIMFDNVKEKMQSLKGVFKEDEIKYIKETKSYENYMNGGFFTYIDTEDIFNKLISRKLTSFAILNCSDLDRWNKLLLGEDEE